MVSQPDECSSDPAKNEAQATVPNMMKSLAPCALPRSAGVWQSVTMAVAPIKPKFQPIPRKISAPQK